jgi:hypothetical protein
MPIEPREFETASFQDEVCQVKAFIKELKAWCVSTKMDQLAPLAAS